LSTGQPTASTEDLAVRMGGRTALAGVSLQLDQGIVVLAGPNGSGKSTLLRVLATLRKITSGDAAVDGQSLRTRGDLREVRRRTGYLAQEPTQHAHLTVAEAVDYAAWLKGVAGPDRRRACAQTLETLDLESWAGHRLRELSGGTRRRAHLAQALVHGPSVLLLDEPTNGIDAEHRLEFRALLRRVSAGRLILLSTHVTEDIELLADRVVVLTAGKAVFDGSAADLAELGRQTDPDDQASRPVERGLRAVTGSG
jgi:ABC-2 type transport system ATP-binding protein